MIEVSAKGEQAELHDKNIKTPEDASIKQSAFIKATLEEDLKITYLGKLREMAKERQKEVGSDEINKVTEKGRRTR